MKKAGFDVVLQQHKAHHKINGCYKEHFQLRIVNHKLRLFARLQLAYGGCVPQFSWINKDIIKLRSNQSLRGYMNIGEMTFDSSEIEKFWDYIRGVFL